MPVTLNAVDCPLPPLPISVVFAEDSRSVSGVPPMSDNLTQAMLGGGAVAALNYNAAVNDILAKYGSGTYAVIRGYDPSAGTGLNVEISAGHACITGLRESKATIVKSVDPSIARIQLWLNTDGTITTVNNSLTPPAGEVTNLGSCVTDGSGVTSVDTSGVMFYRQGRIFRQTADTGVPGDSPGTERRFWHRTASATYYWDGLSYLLMAGTTARRGTDALKTGEVDGDLYFPNDGHVVYIRDGGVLEPHGPIRPVLPPVDNNWDQASLTALNAGSLTKADHKGSLIIEWPTGVTSTAQVRGFHQTDLATPYSIKFGVVSPPNFVDGGGRGFCLFFRDNSGGDLLIGLFSGARFKVDYYNSPTSFGNGLINIAFSWQGGPMYFAICNDGTDIGFKWSGDGYHWRTIYREAISFQIGTVDDIGVGGIMGRAGVGLVGFAASIFHVEEDTDAIVWD